MARICAGPASGCDARALPLPWCRRPSSLPYSYLQRLAELLVARRYCCHPPAFRPTRRQTATQLSGEGFALSARPWPTPYRFCCQRRRDRLALRKRVRSRISAAGRASLAAANRPLLRCSAAPLRPSRAARRRDGCRGGNCVIVCVCIVCGATRAMRATRARGASTEPVECRKCSRHHRPDLVVAVFHEHEHAGHRWKHRDEHDKLHQLLVDVLNVPSRAQHASAGCPS